MGSIRLALIVSAFAFCRAAAGIETSLFGDQPKMTIVSPVDYQVCQRSGGAADISVTVVLPAGYDSAAVKVGVVGSKSNGDWKELTVHHELRYQGTVTVEAGGWYQVMIEARQAGRDPLKASIEHVGVGEVFVVGGQSNSTNYGEVKTHSESGRVVVFDGEKWTLAADPLPGVDGKGGSPWCHFGDVMAERLGVPIAIVPVGKGSTSVRQWLPKGERVQIEPTKTYGMKKVGEEWESEGLLYGRMVERMKSLGPNGFRAMLWHQGESDAHQANGHTLPGVKYKEYLEHIIVQSRKDIGWEAPWFVAQVSWGSPDSPADEDIRAAQKGVWDDHVALPGPDTDTLLGENRQKNGTAVHMTEKGLKAHGELWARVVGEWIEKGGK